MVFQAFLEGLFRALAVPLMGIWDGFLGMVPNLVAGILLLIVGYVVGSAFAYILKTFLVHSRIDDHIRKAGVAHSIGFISISNLASGLLKWYIFALFLLPVAEFMKLGLISSLLKDFALWIPDLIAAIVILLFGLIVADYLADRMLHAKRKGVRLFSSFVRWFIIIFVVLTALDQVGVDISLATNTTLILAAGFALGVAIALGLGFGLALKDEAKSTIKQFKKLL